MKILEMFSYHKILEFIAVYQWLESNNYTIEDAKAEIAARAQEIVDSSEDRMAKRMIEVRDDPNAREVLDWCETCDYPMYVIESKKDECESELICPKCKESICSDVSVSDYNTQLSAKLKKQEMYYSVSEERETLEERLRRREICLKCEYLIVDRCRLCGCSTKHRSYYKILSCPDKRW